MITPSDISEILAVVALIAITLLLAFGVPAAISAFSFALFYLVSRSTAAATSFAITIGVAFLCCLYPILLSFALDISFHIGYKGLTP